jgi:hypothetical protein
LSKLKLTYIEDIMNTKKKFAISILLLCSLLAASCGGNQGTDVAVIVALTQTAMALEQQSVLPTATNISTQAVLVLTSTAESIQPTATVTNTPPPYYGSVTGTVSFPDSSVAAAWVYAVETSNGLWAKAAISNSGSASPYLLELAPGTYQIFAFPSGVGYSLDGKMLSAVVVTSGQTVSGVNLVAPTQTTCGPSFGVPAAPDGNFAAVAGASADCLASAKQDYTPMSAGDCSALSAAVSASAGVQGEIIPSAAFNDYVNSKNGTGCEVSLVGTGQTFQSFTDLSRPVEDTLTSMGWQQDMRYGAAGAGSIAMAYSKGKNLCLMTAKSKPSDSSLCSGNEPFAVCWERLTPEQKMFSVTLNCAQANFP